MRFIPLAVFLFIFMFSSGALAAEPRPNASGNPNLTQEDLDRLIKTIEDPLARDAFLTNLKTLRDARTATVTHKDSLGELILTGLSAKVEQAKKLIEELIGELLQVPGWIKSLADIAANPQARYIGFEIFLKLAAVLGAAWLAQYMTQRILRGLQLSLAGRPRAGLGGRIALSLLFFVLSLVPLAVFGLVTQLILPLTYPRASLNLIALAIINSSLLARGLNILGQSLFMPHSSNLRIFRMTDARAAYLTNWWYRFVNICVYSYFFFGFSQLLMLPPGLIGLLEQCVGLLVAVLALIFILQNKNRIARDIKSELGGRASALAGLRAGVAETWHIFAILYIFALYAVWALGLPGGFQFLIHATLITVIVLVATKLVSELTQRTITRSFDLSKDLQEKVPGLDARLNHYLPQLLRVAQIALYIMAVFLIAEAWGVQAIEFLSTSTGKKIANALGSIFIVLVIAAVTWEALNGFIDHYLLSKVRNGAERRQRLQTLLPLLRNIIRLAIFVMVSLIILSQIGINIAPLLAGAGVIGLAIGFGAQTLVKDIITGLFILAEDTIAVGDVVDIDGHEGKVEGITIRTIRIRDDEGAVHTLPYSVIKSIKNKSKDYSNVILELPLARAADYDAAVDLIEKIGRDLRSGAIGQFLLSKLEVQGVSKISDGTMTVRARVRVSPGRQRPVTRAFNLALKKALEQSEINLA